MAYGSAQIHGSRVSYRQRPLLPCGSELQVRYRTARRSPGSTRSCSRGSGPITGAFVWNPAGKSRPLSKGADNAESSNSAWPAWEPTPISNTRPRGAFLRASRSRSGNATGAAAYSAAPPTTSISIISFPCHGAVRPIRRTISSCFARGTICKRVMR